jgi:dihydrofolate reductase
VVIGQERNKRTARRFLPATPPAAAIADNTTQKEEQTMIILEYLAKAAQDDARRAGERDRLVREARRARRARRQRLDPAAPAKRRTGRGKIVVSENVTLDGVIQDPAGDEGPRARGWVGPIGHSPQLAKLALDEAPAAGAFPLGRRSYERLAARWPSRSGEPADRLNSLPKYVVSATHAHPAWNNSTVLKGDVLNQVPTLKQHTDGDIVIAGSVQLARTLIEHDLVDELRLKILPVALGAGERLFGQTSNNKPMRLLDTQTLEGGIAYLTYQSIRDAQQPHTALASQDARRRFPQVQASRRAPHEQQMTRRRPQQQGRRHDVPSPRY